MHLIAHLPVVLCSRLISPECAGVAKRKASRDHWFWPGLNIALRCLSDGCAVLQRCSERTLLSLRLLRLQLLLRQYVIRLKKSGVPRMPRVELVEMGPRLDLEVRRSRVAPPDLAREAMKQAAVGKKKVKLGRGLNVGRAEQGRGETGGVP
jgi:hypothetical protein